MCPLYVLPPTLRNFEEARPSMAEAGGDDGKRKCLRCYARLALTNFAEKKRGVRYPGERVSTCNKCTAEKQVNRRDAKKSKGANKENERAEDSGSDSDTSNASNHSEADAYNEADFFDLPRISIEDFFAILNSKKAEPRLRLAAKVDIEKLVEFSTLKDKASSLAELVWDEMEYRFV